MAFVTAPKGDTERASILLLLPNHAQKEQGRIVQEFWFGNKFTRCYANKMLE